MASIAFYRYRKIEFFELHLDILLLVNTMDTVLINGGPNFYPNDQAVTGVRETVDGTANASIRRCFKVEGISNRS